MKLIKKPWFIPILLTVIILAANELYMNVLVTKADTLSEDQVRVQLENMYEAEVTHLTLKDKVYEVQLTRNGAGYLAKVDVEDGRVLSMLQTKEIAVVVPEKTVENETPIKPIEQPEVTKPDPQKTPEKEVPQKPKSPDKKQDTHAQSKPPISQNKPKSSIIISEKEAMRIALGEVKGEVDDIDFEKTTDGGYYLVEVEIDVDDGPDQATIQIHAITGKIMTVTWDD